MSLFCVGVAISLLLFSCFSIHLHHVSSDHDAKHYSLSNAQNQQFARGVPKSAIHVHEVSASFPTRAHLWNHARGTAHQLHGSASRKCLHKLACHAILAE